MPGRQPRKKALLIGINYFQQQGELRGCINDVNNLKTFLIENGFKNDPTHMTILTDDNKNTGMPLRNNIVSAMMWLADDNQPGDLLFFHYSGHGSQVQDISGDEDDGSDETIVPLDYKKKGQIIDDDMHNLLVKPLKAGVRMVAIFDSCHSGTALDLPFIYKPSGGYMGSGPSKGDLMSNLLGAGMSLVKGDKKGAAKLLGKFAWEGVQVKFGSPAKQNTNSSPADIVMISGCRDDQTSADANIGGQATGAMSFALMLELKRKKNPTLIELLNGMRDIMVEKKFTQVPQMSTGHEMDPNTPFSLQI